MRLLYYIMLNAYYFYDVKTAFEMLKGVIYTVSRFKSVQCIGRV
jgi:hypothetical protein